MSETEFALAGIAIVILELAAIVALGGVLYWLRGRVDWLKRLAP